MVEVLIVFPVGLIPTTLTTWTCERRSEMEVLFVIMGDWGGYIGKWSSVTA